MSLSIRIEQLIKHLDSNPNKFGNGFESISPERIRQIIKGKKVNPGYDFIKELLEKYPDVSTDWLILGKGEMLKSNNYSIPEKNIDILQEAEHKNQKIIKINCIECISKQNEISDLKNELNEVNKKYTKCLEELLGKKNVC